MSGKEKNTEALNKDPEMDLLSVVKFELKILRIAGMLPFRLVSKNGISFLECSRSQLAYCFLLYLINVICQLLISLKIDYCLSFTYNIIDIFVETADQFTLLFSSLISHVFILANSKKICSALNKLNLFAACVLEQDQQSLKLWRKRSLLLTTALLSFTSSAIFSSLYFYFPAKEEKFKIQYLWEISFCFDLLILSLTAIKIMTLTTVIGRFISLMHQQTCDEFLIWKLSKADDLAKDVLEEMIDMYGPLNIVNISACCIEIMYHSFYLVSPRDYNSIQVFVMWLIYFIFHLVLLMSSCIFVSKKVI